MASARSSSALTIQDASDLGRQRHGGGSVITMVSVPTKIPDEFVKCVVIPLVVLDLPEQESANRVAPHHRVEELTNLILLPNEMPLDGWEIKRALLVSDPANSIEDADGNELVCPVGLGTRQGCFGGRLRG